MRRFELCSAWSGVMALASSLVCVICLGCASSSSTGSRGDRTPSSSYSSSASSSDSFMIPESDSESTADGEAFTAAAMHFRKRMPARKPTVEQDWEFYFKHCAMNGNESYFSKTSYDCSGPFY